MSAPTPPSAASHAAEPDLLAGLAGVLRGARFVREHPRLWTWIALPLLINVVLFAVLTVLGWRAAQSLLPDPATADWGWFDGLRAVLVPVLGVLMTIVAALAALLVTLLLAGVVNAPFYDLLSEQVEAAFLGRPAPGRSWAEALADTRAALSAALALAAQQAAVMSLLFLLSFTAVGVPLFVVGGFFFTGFALVDVTLARQRRDARARRAFAGRRALLLIGLGLPVSLLPPLQPFGIVGATLLLLGTPTTPEPTR